jgi:FlaA1/EpsC-like NDP-sugar epimerase
VLQRILEEERDLMPIGFLDDNPWYEGKRFHGFPVFGGHWKLVRLAATLQVAEIIIADQTIRPEVLRRLKAQALDLRIPVRTFTFRVDLTSAEADRSAAPRDVPVVSPPPGILRRD